MRYDGNGRWPKNSADVDSYARGCGLELTKASIFHPCFLVHSFPIQKHRPGSQKENARRHACGWECGGDLAAALRGITNQLLAVVYTRERRDMGEVDWQAALPRELWSASSKGQYVSLVIDELQPGSTGILTHSLDTTDSTWALMSQRKQPLEQHRRRNIASAFARHEVLLAACSRVACFGADGGCICLKAKERGVNACALCQILAENKTAEVEEPVTTTPAARMFPSSGSLSLTPRCRCTHSTGKWPCHTHTSHILLRMTAVCDRL